MMNSSGSSEWNEQMMFSQLFFSATSYTREAQLNFSPVRWAAALDSKISACIGIFDNEKTFNRIIKLRNDLFKLRCETANATFNRSKIETDLFNACFFLEAELDRKVHKIMPFLKLKVEVDFDDL